MKKIISFLLSFALPFSLFCTDPSVITLKTRLEEDFAKMNEDAKNDRMLEGALCIGTGFAMGLGGYVVSTNRIPTVDEQERVQIVSKLLYTGTFVFTSMGLAVLTIKSKPEKAYVRFNAITASGDSDEVIVRKGEREFRILAHSMEMNRMVGGSVFTVLGATMFFLNPVIINGVVAGGGVMELVFKSKPEKKWNEYKEDKMFYFE